MALVLKYFDPTTKQYEYGTVKDVGDLTKLLTSEKTDLVSAINSLVLNGHSGGNGDSDSTPVPQNVLTLISELNQKIAELKQSNLNEAEIASINDMIRNKLADVLQIKTEIVAELDGSIAEKVASEIDSINANNEQFISNMQAIADDAKRKSNEVSKELESVRGRLSGLDNFQSSAEARLDNLGNQISAKVSREEFDLVDATVKNQKASIDILQDEVRASVKTDQFNHATNRISQMESNFSVLQSGIESKVTRQEVLGIVEQNSKLGSNLLRNTRDFYGWEQIGVGANITADFYRECKVVQVDNNTDYYQATIDNLTVGKTYAASIYAKTSTGNNMAQVVFYIDGDSYVLANEFEDTSAINQWKRLYVLFVAKRESSQISFRFNLLGNSDKGYLCAPKVELEKATDWQPYIDDDYSAIIRNETSIKQNSNQISSVAESLKSTGNSVSELKTWQSQTAESLTSTAQSISSIEGRLGSQESQISQMSSDISQKVTEKRVTDIISATQLYANNNILNSNFDKGFDKWVNSEFVIQKENGNNYAAITRSGVTQSLIASLSSNKFSVSNGNKINFGFDAVIKSSLDDNRIVTIELFNIGDTRVYQKTFVLSDLVKAGDSYYGDYTVNREDVAKAHIKLHLYKNGSVYFTNVYAKIGDIKQVGWSQSPEDARKIVQELEAGIKNTASNLSLYVKKDNVVQEINASNNELKIDFNKVRITGDTLARHLETQTLDVTRGFKVVKNGETVLGADSSGNVEMNVKKLRINSEAVATSSELSKEISKVNQRIPKKQVPLVHTSYNNAVRYYFIVIHDILADYVGKEAKVTFDLKVESNGFEREFLFYHYQYSGIGIKLGEEAQPQKRINVTKQWQTFSFSGEVIRKPIPNTYHQGALIIYDPTGDNKFSLRNIKIEVDDIVTTDLLDNKESIIKTELNQKIIDVTPKVIEGKNILLNTKFNNIKKNRQVTVNGQSVDITYPEKWNPTYNGGIANPTTSYHTYMDSTKFGFPVAVFNESDGGRGWKAIIQRLNDRIDKPGKYQFSADLYAEGSGTRITAGFFCFLKNGNTQHFPAGRIAINPTTENKWIRYNDIITLHDDVDFSKGIDLYIYGYNFSANSILYMKDPQLEKGAILTGYKQSDEDAAKEILDKLNASELLSYKNEVASLLAELQGKIESKTDLASFESFEDTYKKWQALMNHNVVQASESIINAANRIAVVEQNLGEGAADWIFSKTNIRLSDDGVVVGDRSTGSYVLVNGNQIAFYSGSTEPVAYITNGVLKINQAVFVKSIQVDTFVQYAAVPNHLTFRFVGAGG